MALSRSARVIAVSLMFTAAAETVRAQGFGRGDADCSAHTSAADIVASLRGLNDESLCGNDDCDRSGDVDVADTECTAQCLFDDCVAPPHAPRVLTAAPATGPAIRPFTSLRLEGMRFGADLELITVDIGGVPAELIDVLSDDEVLVSVPALPPGPAIVRVTSGDLTGPPITIIIAPQTAVGVADTYDGTLALLDLVLQRFAELDLESAYGEDAEAVLEAISLFREDLAAFRSEYAADPNLSAEMRQEIDRAIDSSGAPEQLRRALADINGLIDLASQIDTADPRGTLVVANIGRAVRTATLVVRAAGAAAGTGLSTPEALIAVGIGTLAGTLSLAGSAALPPLITDLTFTDRSGQRSEAIHVDGRIVVRGRRLTGSKLVVKTRTRELEFEPEQSGPDFRQFRLSPTFGFCDAADIFLRRTFPLAGRSERIRWRIAPELIQLLPIDPATPQPLIGRPGQTLQMLTNGVAGCPAFARFSLPNASIGATTRSPIRAYDSSRVGTAIPNLATGDYLVEAQVENSISNSLSGLHIFHPIQAVRVVCSTNRLFLSPAQPERANCTATFRPDGARAPIGSRLIWNSTDGGAVAIEGGGSQVMIHADAPGVSEISATLKLADEVLAETEMARTIRVEDVTEPTVRLTSNTPRVVAAGAALRFIVEASDNYSVSRIVLRSTGDAAINPQQDFPCATLEDVCQASLTVNLKEMGIESSQISVVADVYDGVGNKATSETFTFTIRDNECPTLTITAPAPGSVVDPAAMVLVEATAVDNDPNDGVKKFRYSASGDALVRLVSQDLELPVAQANAPLRFTFEVKGAEALAAVSNRTVNVSVEAFDTAGKSCGPQTLALTAAGTGDVQVILSWDNSNDLDLAVVEPSGNRIWYGSPTSPSGGRLDVDANPGCTSASSSPVENIFWPAGQAPTGPYQVFVTFFEACTMPAVSSSYTVRVIVDGEERPAITGSISSGTQQVTAFTR